jgi:hypothetical protein
MTKALATRAVDTRAAPVNAAGNRGIPATMATGPGIARPTEGKQPAISFTVTT